jgi:hypothetical protein
MPARNIKSIASPRASILVAQAVAGLHTIREHLESKIRGESGANTGLLSKARKTNKEDVSDVGFLDGS